MLEAFLEGCLGAPAEEIRSAGGVEGAARLAVGLGGIPNQLALETGQAGDHLGQVFDADLLPGTQVDRLGAVEELGGGQDAVGGIAGVQEFAGRRAIAPQHHFLIAARLGFDALADQGRDDVRSLQVKVVARAVQVDRQQVDGIEAILLAVGLGLDEQHLLGQAVGGVGLFGVAIPERLFAEGDGREFRISADGADGDEFLDAALPGFVHELDAHHQVDVEEIGGAGAVGANAAGQGGQVNDQVGAGGIVHALDIGRIHQVVFLDPGNVHLGCTALLERLQHEGA